MSSQELFGDLNTYSQGIWKTRVSRLCRSGKIGEILQNLLYNDRESITSMVPP